MVLGCKALGILPVTSPIWWQNKMGVTPPGKPVTNSPQTGQQHSFDQAQAARLVARQQQASRYGNAAYGSQVQAVSDPAVKLPGYKVGFQDTGRLCTGTIVDGTAIANCYKVFVVVRPLSDI